RTANHETGYSQFIRLKTNAQGSMPTIYAIIGSQRQGQAVSHLDPEWTTPTNMTGRPDQFDKAGDLVARLSRMEGEELEVGARVLAKQASLIRARGKAYDSVASNLEQTAVFYRRFKDHPFKEETWSQDPKQQFTAQQFQRALWSMQHDMARSIF